MSSLKKYNKIDKFFIFRRLNTYYEFEKKILNFEIYEGCI